MFDDFKQPAALAINGSAIAAYPAIVEAAIERKWEFIEHRFTQRNMQKVANEREDIRKTTEATLKATGKRPRGWLGPGLTGHRRRARRCKNSGSRCQRRLRWRTMG